MLGDDLVPVVPVERFLAYLASIERSPNTVKAYAHDLKDWLIYLAGCGLGWQAVTLEEVAGFVAWLRLPPAARDGRVAVLPSVEHHCAASSVNRKLLVTWNLAAAEIMSARYDHELRSCVGRHGDAGQVAGVGQA